MSAWLWLTGTVVLLVGLVAAVLTSPIELAVRARYPTPAPVELDLRWLHGALALEGFEIGGGAEDEAEEVEVPEPSEPARPAPEREPPEAEPAPEPEPEPEPTPEPEPEPAPEPDREEDEEMGRVEEALDSGVRYLEMRSAAERKVKIGLAVLRTRDLPLAITRMLRDLVRAVHIDRIALHAGFGFGSPAETGKVFGQLKAAFAWTHATERIQVDLDPDFHAVGFEAGAEAEIEARTWDLVRPFIVFALAPPVWNAIGNAREAAKDA